MEAWGRGISKIREQCAGAKLPEPTFRNDGSDFWVIFRKDIYSKEELSRLGLNERQIKAVLFAKEKGRITNKEYQEINNCSRNTASSDLNDLVARMILDNSDVGGAGSYYRLQTVAR